MLEFTVRPAKSYNCQGLPCGAYLITDDWDDWFTYSTMYYLKYVDENLQVHDIGSVKIGQFGMKQNGQRRPNIPDNFETLDSEYFSLGQSADYYVQLKLQGEDIRETILKALNDMAFNEEIYEICKADDVTQTSLLRGISHRTVIGQFRRIARGGARLTKYNFEYILSSKDQNKTKFLFKVKPESNPPTNIHVIIGRNGVGKTHVIKNMISSLIYSDSSNEDDGFFDDWEEKLDTKSTFANLICVAFSAFDDYPEPDVQVNNDNIPYIFIGLNQNNGVKQRREQFIQQLKDSLYTCLSNRSKNRLWHETIMILDSDPMFAESGISNLEFKSVKIEFENSIDKTFHKLSSGHMIILLTITRLVEFVEEKSLILLDEPETHLHPPLLSAFTRSLSSLLLKINGVAIITTHSPVILQEVPSTCVWRIRRNGIIMSAERLALETFGANINALTTEIFGLEVTNSGFHRLLAERVKKHDETYAEIIDVFNNELGDEAKAILKSLIAIKEMEPNEND